MNLVLVGGIGGLLVLDAAMIAATIAVARGRALGAAVVALFAASVLVLSLALGANHPSHYDGYAMQRTLAGATVAAAVLVLVALRRLPSGGRFGVRRLARIAGVVIGIGETLVALLVTLIAIHPPVI